MRIIAPIQINVQTPAIWDVLKATVAERLDADLEERYGPGYVHRVYVRHPHKLRFAVRKPTVAVLDRGVLRGVYWTFRDGSWTVSSAKKGEPSIVWVDSERKAAIEIPPSEDIDVAIDAVMSGATDTVTRAILAAGPLVDLTLLAVTEYAKRVRNETLRSRRES